MREALDRDPGYTSSAALLAEMIEDRSPAEAKKLRERIVAVLEPKIRSSETKIVELRRLRDAASGMGRAAVADRATAEIGRREREVATRDAVFREENLAQGSGRLLGPER